MKKLLTDWRTYLIIAQIIVCMFLLFCEPDNSKGMLHFFLDMILTRVGGIMILMCLVCEYHKWYMQSGLDSIFGDDDDDE